MIKLLSTYFTTMVDEAGYEFNVYLNFCADCQLPTSSSSKLEDFCINLQSHILM